MKNEKGFQMIELLIVLALAVVIIGMTISIGFRAVRDAGYTGAVNKLLAEISYVKQLAARENRYVLLEFSSDGHSYSIFKQEKVSNRDMTSSGERILVRTGSFYDQGGKFNKNEFFAGGSNSNYSFAVNSMGMVYTQADTNDTNSFPSTITIPVYFKNGDGSYGSMDTITISASGGINVKNTKKV